MGFFQNKFDLREEKKVTQGQIACSKVATWIFEYDPEAKKQSHEWKSYGSPRPVKARKSKAKVKVMVIVFFNIQGIVHFKFLLQGQTVNQTVYKEILWCLVRSVLERGGAFMKPTHGCSITITLLLAQP